MLFRISTHVQNTKLAGKRFEKNRPELFSLSFQKITLFNIYSFRIFAAVKVWSLAVRASLKVERDTRWDVMRGQFYYRLIVRVCISGGNLDV